MPSSLAIFILVAFILVVLINSHNIVINRINKVLYKKNQEKLIPKPGELYKILYTNGVVGWCPNERNTMVIENNTILTIIETNIGPSKLPQTLRAPEGVYHSVIVNEMVFLIGQYYFNLEYLKRIEL